MRMAVRLVAIFPVADPSEKKSQINIWLEIYVDMCGGDLSDLCHSNTCVETHVDMCGGDFSSEISLWKRS
jgi:hypothetical protein